jgi:hypothetical protein
MAVFPPAGGFPVGDPPTEQPDLGSPALFLADAIDPSTGDYRSIQRGVDPIEAQAVEALMVRRASGSAVRDDGHKLHEIRFVNERTGFLIRSEVEYAWRRLIEARQIRLDKLEVETAGDTANVVIHFTNLVSGKSGTMPLPLLALLPRAIAA